MCFYVHDDFPNKLKAEKDIKVWKVLKYNQYTKKIVSPYQNTEYILGALKRSVLGKKEKITWFDKRNIINRGLHSYKTREEARELAGCYTKGKVYRAIIPKGATYYYNPSSKEYVSNQLIVGEKK